MNKIYLNIKGMHCRSCEILLEQSLGKVLGVKRVEVNHKIGQAVVFYDIVKPEEKLLSRAVEEAGYNIGNSEKLTWFSTNKNNYLNLLKGALLAILVYLLVKYSGVLTVGENLANEASLGAALLIGLVAGVSTCMALIGGLVLGLASAHNAAHPEAQAWQKFRPHLFFNLGRIGGFFLLGGLIGVAGSALKLSTNLVGLLTVFVGFLMIFLGLKLLGIFPILENKNITLPKSVSKFFGVGKENKEYSHNGAFWAGALTFFLPCGFTQAMQLYAVSTGSFWLGGLAMAIFAFGTSFGLLGIGFFSSLFKGQKAKIFFSAVGFLVILLGIFNIINASNLLSFGGAGKFTNNKQNISQGEVQTIKMTQDSSGYSPNVLTVKKGVPVRWIINSVNPYSCASSIVMRKYGISRNLEKGENVIEFTPTESGEILFSCGMGMYRGKFIVTD